MTVVRSYWGIKSNKPIQICRTKVKSGQGLSFKIINPDSPFPLKPFYYADKYYYHRRPSGIQDGIAR